MSVTRKEVDIRKAALRMIGPQFPQSHEGIFMLAIISQAIHDVCSKTVCVVERDSAYEYLANDLVHAEVCGVDAGWVRKVLVKLEIIA